MAFGKLKRKIRSRCGIVKLAVFARVEPVAAALQAVQMKPPGFKRVFLIRPDGAEDRIPQEANLFILPCVREHLGCP
ncbi:hypothetical protein D3C71_1436280 [compost metagenome]